MTVNRDCQLADGRPVVLRPAGPGDVAAITRLYLDLSAGSFLRRFHGGQPAPAQVARWAVLGSGTACIVAASPADPDCLAAEARYVPVGAGTAELALTVADGYQGAGLGRVLLEALVQRARAGGLQRLRATVLLSNKPMLRLLQRHGWALADATEDFSVTCLEISAAGGMPGWPAQPTSRRVLVDLLADSDFAVVFVDVTPVPPEHLAATQTVGQQQHKCGIQRIVLGSFEEGPGLGHSPWRDVLAFPGR
jgi:GNAT superfamily N-acetyltransferase